MKKKPMISVVIPTYNEERDISDCLRSLKKQSYKPIEIIVVDDGSTDKTREIVKKFKGVRLIEGEHKGPGFSRNLGAKNARGEILSFVDADMTFHKDYLKHLAKPIVEGKTIGSEERFQKAANLDKVWSRCWGAYTLGYDKKRTHGNVFRAILKKEFLKMGGFDPKYGYADDMTFYFKYGLRSLLVDEAGCYHKNPETLKEIYKQSRWIGASLDGQYRILKVPVINLLIGVLLIPSSVFMIPALAVKKYITAIKKHRCGFGDYLIFSAARYFGTLKGLFNKLVQGKNVR